MNVKTNLFIFLSFLQNGAQVITTASYQLNIDLLTDVLKCSVEDAKRILKKSARLAHEAIQECNLSK